MKSFFGTDRLKRSRILKAILFIIVMISAVSSMSLLYKSVYAQEGNQHKYAAKKRVLFIAHIHMHGKQCLNRLPV